MEKRTEGLWSALLFGMPLGVIAASFFSIPLVVGATLAGGAVMAYLANKK